VLRHQLGQHFVSALDPLLQVLEALLLAWLVERALASNAAASFSKTSFCQR
jgi:hypothetical protein